MMEICWCNRCCNSSCSWYHTEEGAIDCKDYRERQTNADNIRAMTDEQLAAMCAGQTYYQNDVWGKVGAYIGPDGEIYVTNERAVRAWLKWLKQPAEED